jgi:hypothetical protein
MFHHACSSGSMVLYRFLISNYAVSTDKDRIGRPHLVFIDELEHGDMVRNSRLVHDGH